MLTGQVTVVVATRNRRPGLCRTLAQLTGLPEQPPIVVVDNGSDDGTVAAVRAEFPHVELVALRRNLGAHARNYGVRRARTPYVALSDDDSWWEPGALTQAVKVLDAYPSLGLIAGTTLVGADDAPDPLNAVLAASPLPPGGLPGPRLLGFLGCAAVARRDAFLAAGGYSRLLRIGGEEELLAYDLAARGWPISYQPDVVVHHWPSASRDPRRRRIQELRNHVLIGWLRRPLAHALAGTAQLATVAWRDRDALAARALAEVLISLPRILPQRRPLPVPVEADIQLLEHPRAA
jgi:GT2 family glycosyltransferase